MNQSTIQLSQTLPKIAQELDKQIEQAAGERMAFTLVVFSPDRASYISTADRAESIQQLRFLLDQWETGMPDVKAHEVQ